MLVDSDILIWHMRGKASAARFLDSLNDLCISTITYMELVQGMRNKRELAALKTSLNRRKAQVLPITEAISERAVQLVEDYFLSHSLKLADALIAATALEHNLTLATANTKHYRVIQGLALEAFKLE